MLKSLCWAQNIKAGRISNVHIVWCHKIRQSLKSHKSLKQTSSPRSRTNCQTSDEILLVQRIFGAFFGKTDDWGANFNVASQMIRCYRQIFDEDSTLALKAFMPSPLLFKTWSTKELSSIKSLHRKLRMSRQNHASCVVSRTFGLLLRCYYLVRRRGRAIFSLWEETAGSLGEYSCILSILLYCFTPLGYLSVLLSRWRLCVLANTCSLRGVTRYARSVVTFCLRSPMTWKAFWSLLFSLFARFVVLLAKYFSRSL